MLRPVQDWLRSAWPFLVPAAYLVVICALQPTGRLGLPDGPLGGLGRLVFDDWDVAAYGLRGLNAQLGRKAGHDTDPPWLSESEYLAELGDPDMALQPRYFLEYPQTCLLLFRLGWLWQDAVPHPPPAVLDGHYANIVVHPPRDDAERQLCQGMRAATLTYLVLMTLCLWLLMAVFRAGYQPGEPIPIWPLLLPASLYFSLNRFDVVPALLMALSFAALGRRRTLLSAVFLATATAFKVYPILAAPLVCRYLWPERRSAVGWALGFATTLALWQVPTLVVHDWEALAMPYKFQLHRDPFPPTIYGFLVPPSFAGNEPWAKALRLGTVALVLGLSLVRPMEGLDDLLRRAGVVVLVFASLSVFYSPQWVLWFAPMLLPLARSRARQMKLVVALDVVTYLTFPVIMDRDWGPLPYFLLLCAVTYLRFLIVACLFAQLGKGTVGEPLLGPEASALVGDEPAALGAEPLGCPSASPSK